MNIKFEKTYKVVLREQSEFNVIVVGVGGTGSQVVVNMARLAYHCRSVGINVDVHIIDGDVIEDKNVGRQLFSPADVGVDSYKASVLAMRMNRWLGLSIKASPVNLLMNNYGAISNSGRFTFMRMGTIVIGCVDNYKARRVIERLVVEKRCWWIDCGNDEYSGQVLTGNKGDFHWVSTMRSEPSEISVSPVGIASGIPLPSIQLPELLEKPSIKADSCAVQLAGGRQSLMINQTLANVAVQQVADIILRRRVETMATFINLDPPAMSSNQLTKANLETACGDRIVLVEMKNESSQ